ncbi:hypothetical protein [uncultured Kocuria sp.]|uniref:hypothetical protein n=1 Tax=uncultured Kocuria sp. TaxID=259305 RepID=UPI002595F511|nr:hypothetical protein [uncultured Kocuria sp.]MCT1367586.1 hypothetical protein [Rothia sp. p3-SID1597]
MDSTGQPYLRALTEGEPGPWRSALGQTPLYWAGLLVIWTVGILGRFSGAQSVSAAGLHAVAPTITFITWLILLVYTGFLILTAIRPSLAEPPRPGLTRRVLRAIAPSSIAVFFLALIQAGLVLIAAVHRGPSTGMEPLWKTTLFYALESAVGVATFCTVFAFLAVAFRRVRSWWRYSLFVWIAFAVVDRIQRYASFVPFPWSDAAEFHSGLDFGHASVGNVYINAFPGNVSPSGSGVSDGAPPFANIELSNIWINLWITALCSLMLITAIAVSAARTRERRRRNGEVPQPRSHAYTGTSGEDFEEPLIPWDRVDEPRNSRRLGP